MTALRLILIWIEQSACGLAVRNIAQRMREQRQWATVLEQKRARWAR